MLEALLEATDSVNVILWDYALTTILICCAVFFTFRTRGVQFRLLKEAIKLLSKSDEKKLEEIHKENKKHISSVKAFAVSLASRIGVGNLAGVATAITLGGPGAMFWMWMIALLGAATAFVESTLAQLYKRNAGTSFIGGPAYYMQYGMGKRWMGVIFAVLMAISFGLAVVTLQSNTVSAALSLAFGVDELYSGIFLTIFALIVIFGGIHRIASVNAVVVPIMAVCYFAISLGVVIMNYDQIPMVFNLIMSNAFGLDAMIGGGIGATLAIGLKRGVVSNEAGMGSAPHAAATADISHPVKQGLIQALGVFTDTLVICSCTAAIILFSSAPLDGSVNGIQLTQVALESIIGPVGSIFIAIALLVFAFCSIISCYYYGESNVRFITKNRTVLLVYRLLVAPAIIIGALISLDLAWGITDLMMGLITITNVIAIIVLAPKSFAMLEHYQRERKKNKYVVFRKEDLPEGDHGDIECW